MKMRTIFIYMLLDDLKIKICNDALSYIHRNDDYVRESTLDDYLEKIYKEQYSRKMSYTILDTILIKRYQLIERKDILKICDRKLLTIKKLQN